MHISMHMTLKSLAAAGAAGGGAMPNSPSPTQAGRGHNVFDGVVKVYDLEDGENSRQALTHTTDGAEA